jgi:hypothetical protein
MGEREWGGIERRFGAASVGSARNPMIVGTSSWRKMNRGDILRLTGGPDAWVRAHAGWRLELGHGWASGGGARVGACLGSATRWRSAEWAAEAHAGWASRVGWAARPREGGTICGGPHG